MRADLFVEMGEIGFGEGIGEADRAKVVDQGGVFAWLGDKDQLKSIPGVWEKTSGGCGIPNVTEGNGDGLGDRSVSGSW